MQGNIMGQSGTHVNDSLFPIYQQLIEPTEKYGIWIKGEETIDNIYFQEENYGTVTMIKEEFGGTLSIGIGSDIYIYDDKLQKYDTKTEIVTDITSARPIVETVNVGKDLYYFFRATEYSSEGAYKYNTIDGTHTKLTTLEENEYFKSYIKSGGDYYADNLGTDIYFSQGFKYDTIENVCTLVNLKSSYNVGMIGVGENEIYTFRLVNSSSDRGYLCKYTTDADTNTKLSAYDGDRAIQKAKNKKAFYFTKELMYTGNTTIESSDKVYNRGLAKYNTETDVFYEYEALGSIEQVIMANKKLYCIKGSDLYLINRKISYEGDGLYIITDGSSLSKNLDMESVLEVKKIMNEEEQSIEVYIGNGEEWNLLN